MMYVDSHSHINSHDFDDDREKIVERAVACGVQYIMDVSDDIADTPRIVDFCEKHKNIYTTSGVHPEICDKYSSLSVEDIVKQTTSEYVVGIGECGLDYYYCSNNKDWQIQVFLRHIEAARRTGLPLIVHSRDADADMIDILQNEYKKSPFRGEMHCFCSSLKLAEVALEIGFYISASGIITFNNSRILRDIFEQIPLNRILIETDSPYLSPVPYRGRRNEPAYVTKTAEMLANLKKVDIEEMAKITSDNFFNLFNKVKTNG